MGGKIEVGGLLGSADFRTVLEQVNEFGGQLGQRNGGNRPLVVARVAVFDGDFFGIHGRELAG